MAYCLYSDVTPWFPESYSSTTLAQADITAHIVLADAMIDARLAALYDKFNASSDTPATPTLIKTASMHLAAALALDEINVAGAQDDRIARHREAAEDILSMLLTPGVQMPHETKTGETLTFGTSGGDSYELGDNQAFLALTNVKLATNAGPPNIHTQSVRVTTCTGVTNPTYLRVGEDYRVYWDQAWRKWVFEALSSDVQSAADSGTVTVAYDWDYRKVINRSGRGSSELLPC